MTTKCYKGAPFGTQTARFDVSGVHPQSKMPGTFTESPYCKKSTSEENRRLGPGTYNVDKKTGSFSDNAAVRRIRGPGWQRSCETARQAATPHLRYRDQWKKNKMIEQNMGPGKYDIRDSIDEMSQKPSSRRGVCETTGPRFHPIDKFHALVPGVGTYGEGGIATAAAEEKAKKSPGVVGILSNGSKLDRSIPTVGCGISPSRYIKRSFTEDLSRKVTSLRGPYDLFTGNRNRPMTTGHLSIRPAHNLGPGQYRFTAFTDEWNDRHHGRHGAFSALDQYPELPTERIYLSSLSQWPRHSEDPGPGWYQVRELSGVKVVDSPPFHSSDERWGRRAMKFFTGSNNPVGPGRYDIRKWHELQKKNGCESAFVSATPRMSGKGISDMDRMLQERITPKHKAFPQPGASDADPELLGRVKVY
ncbi:ciliary microtubule-associated protein 2-like [Oscarella lobularis]|uniref:ciliary microtubule-associated protein 2-like n=1 Tax=Oscarella lobularis TaxID=121494 RepID=UPI003313884D